MYIVTINDKKRVVSYLAGTQLTYMQMYAGDGSKRFLDGSDFRSREDIELFVRNWTNYYFDERDKLRPMVR